MLAFSNDYYGFIFRATQSVELFCAYDNGKVVLHEEIDTLLGQYGLLKISSEQYDTLDKNYLLRKREKAGDMPV